MGGIASSWLWLTAGILLLAAEAAMPGVFLFWIGLAAVATGILLFVFPWALVPQLVLFALLALVAIATGRFLQSRSKHGPEDAPFLNERGRSLVGKVLPLETAIVNGAGSVRIGDSVWRVTGPTSRPARASPSRASTGARSSSSRREAEVTEARQSPSPTLAGEQFTPKFWSQLREGYSLADFKADALAGLTVAIVALPLSMAIAIASGLPPERGLATAIVGGFVISLLGGSRFQIGGPAGAFIVLVAAVVGRHGVDGLVLATFMAGGIMILLGLLRLGGLIRLIPQPVLVGFTAGIAVIIFASQIKELLGLDIAKEPAAILPKLAAIWQALPSLKPLAVLVAIASLAIIILQRRYRPTWPGLLFAVAAAAFAVWSLQLDVATIGTRFGGVPSGLPAPSLPDISVDRLIRLLPDALAIALLGAIESLLSAVVADGMTGRRHRSNGELVAQGLANMAAACFGGMPATGTIARTATNVRAGARGPASGMLHAVYLLAFMMIAAPLAYHIPLAALGAVLAIVCWNMAEKKEFAHLLTASWRTAVVLLATFLLTVFVDLIAGIGVGTVLAAILSRLPVRA